MITLQQVLEELNKFDNFRYRFYDGADLNSVIELERKLGYVVPNDFKEFQLFSNGASFFFQDIYCVDENPETNDIYENYLDERYEVGNPIPEYLLPVMPNGRGDHYCLDLRTISDSKESCKVVFWQHDYLYDEDHCPDVETDSFYEFLMKTMEDYLIWKNYDGSNKTT